MTYYRDFREYLKNLEQHGKLTRIKRGINKDTLLENQRGLSGMPS